MYIQNIVTKVDSSANWRTFNPIPKAGEQCIEDLGKGLFRLKVGDGFTNWIGLKYWTSNNSADREIFNVTTIFPLPEGWYYNLTSAITKIWTESRTAISRGCIITFEVSEGKWILYQFAGKKVVEEEVLNPKNWSRVGSGAASEIEYKNYKSGLEAENVQDAIDEVVDIVNTKVTKNEDIVASEDFSVVMYDEKGLVTEGSNIIDGGTF